jgi:hypothetical protein
MDGLFSRLFSWLGGPTPPEVLPDPPPIHFDRKTPPRPIPVDVLHLRPSLRDAQTQTHTEPRVNHKTMTDSLTFPIEIFDPEFGTRAPPPRDPPRAPAKYGFQQKDRQYVFTFKLPEPPARRNIAQFQFTAQRSPESRTPERVRSPTRPQSESDRQTSASAHEEEEESRSSLSD